MVSPVELWPSIAGLVILAAGLVAVRKGLVAAPGPVSGPVSIHDSVFEKLIVLGPVFFAAPLATFGAEHLAVGRSMAEMVPHWIPWHVFWIYFVGIALLAASLSLSLRKYLRWSAPLLAIMFFIFVFSIHIPNVVAHPKDRFMWAVMLRDTSFAAGALALTGATFKDIGITVRRRETTRFIRVSELLIPISRILIAIPLLFFGVVHILRPAFAPGVPLEKPTPAWLPWPHVWAALVGAILLVTGVALLIDKRSRLAAAHVGLVMTLLTLFLYTPILAMDRGTAQVVEGINYVADTLLYAGTVLLLAAALRKDGSVNPPKPS